LCIHLISNVLQGISLGNFNVKGRREDILKLTIGNESLHEISNDNGFTVANFITSKF